MELLWTPEILGGAFVVILLFAYWALSQYFGQAKVDSAVQRMDAYLEAAWQAMLYVEQTLKNQPGVTDEMLRKAAIDYAILLLKQVGFKNITEEDIDVIAKAIEAAVRHFKGEPRDPDDVVLE